MELMWTKTVLLVTVLAIDLSSSQSFLSPSQDGDSLQLRDVPPSAERGPPLGAQFVPLPVVPLPSGAIRQPHRPGHPPPPPSTSPPTPPEALNLIGETMNPPPPPPPTRRPGSSLPLWALYAVTTERPKANVGLLHARGYRKDDGSYSFEYEAANSAAHKESGYTKEDLGTKTNVKMGHYRFVSPEGLAFRVDYLADENGFQAFGGHLGLPKVQSLHETREPDVNQHAPVPVYGAPMQ